MVIHVISLTDFRLSMHSFRSRIMNKKCAQGRNSRHTPKTANFFLTPMVSVQLQCLNKVLPITDSLILIPNKKYSYCFVSSGKDRIQSHTNNCTAVVTASNKSELQVKRQRNKQDLILSNFRKSISDTDTYRHIGV